MTTSDLVPCPVCGSAGTRLYVDGEDRGLVPSSLGSSRTEVSPGRVLRCRTCELGFRQLRPSEEELARLYRRLDGSVYGLEEGARSRTAERHLAIVRHYVRVGRLLDVGCASGMFLRLAAEGGWSVVGIEPAETLAERGKEVLQGRGEILCATLQEASLPAASFDVVTLWDVLEHVPDPVSFLRSSGELLKPGGLLFANVPDLDSLEARLLGARWPLLLPEHLNYFNRGSLKLCGDSAGLTLMRFGRRSASFSIRYVMFRLAQHRVPGAGVGYRIASRSGIGSVLIPVRLGELYGVWRR
ncbi:MAG: class I SAM-dependent methyltransferase [Gemmatimonadetes bacterium]|nr:class I SAM-dependent methyltransferase [Gemmatimonadota bacterium]